MADRIYKSGVGPTSSRAREEALDATVPNPDEVCDPTEIFAIYLTSQPYPIYTMDAVGDEFDITFVGLAGWEPDAMHTGYEWVSATVTHVISYSSYGPFGPDNMHTGYEFVDANLTQLINYSSYQFGPDNMLTGYAFENGTLTHVIGYIFITQPPDWVDEDHIITGITLTP